MSWIGCWRRWKGLINDFNQFMQLDESKIGDIADVVAGGTPKSGNQENFKESGTGIPWLTPADLSGYTGKYISFGARDLSQQGYDSSSAKILPKGSLLFSSRAPIGYVAIAQNEISTNQGFKSFVLPMVSIQFMPTTTLEALRM